MIFSKSTFAGTGKFGSRLLSDSFSSYKSMGHSVISTMMSNIVGIPLSGGDICGHHGNTTAELCTRWYQVGAFYPFSRNHNGVNQAPQEPWVFNDKRISTLTYTDMIRRAMQTKLALLNYYYTELSMLHEEGGAFYRPLFFDFPMDP